MTEKPDDESVPVVILIAEDDPEMLELLEQVLTDEGFGVLGYRGGDEALAALNSEKFDIVLTDLRMPGASGMDLLRSVRARTLSQPVILMTAFGTIESAVEAMKEGAYYYIAKPFDIDDLVGMVTECAKQVRLRKNAEMLSTSQGGETAFPIVFRSKAFCHVIQMVRKVAQSTATVLITGESGTGKEMIAREIHRHSDRKDEPFIAVDANTIPENLLESELFGHAKGAFTGATKDKAGIIEQADTGSLFLDEIGNLGSSVQSKLLRFLQDRTFRRVGDSSERSVDVRFIAATNQDLSQAMKNGDFREDLYYRLAVFHIHLPTLRDRREDIAPLAYHFLRKFNRDFRVEGFRPEVLDTLTDFHWPGNVRQLENAVEHAVILRKAGLIQKRDLPHWLVQSDMEAVHDARSLEAVEKNHILLILDQCDGNQSRTARILGIDRKTLSRKLKAFQIPISETEDTP